MTPDDWKYVEKELSFLYGRCDLICDGYRVGLHVMEVKKMWFGIVAYVNGHLDFKWLRQDCEERKRFMRRVERLLLKPSEQKAEKKLAKLCKRPSRHDKKIVYWEPYWTNVTALRRHICRNNENIQLVHDEIPERTI